MDFLLKIAAITKLSVSHPVIKLIKKSGYDTYAGLVALKTEAEVNSLIEFANARNLQFLPGYKPILLALGEKCLELGEAYFENENIVWIEKTSKRSIRIRYA